MMAAQGSKLTLGALLWSQVNEAYIADLSAQQEETETELQAVREELKQAQAEAAEALAKVQAKSEQAHQASVQVRLLLATAGLLALQTTGNQLKTSQCDRRVTNLWECSHELSSRCTLEH